MDYYKYQLHAHTYPASDCGDMLPHELVDALCCGGYSGCVLTNHFMRGNTGVDRKLPWDEFINAFSKDYLQAKSRAEKHDIDLLFGLEEHLGNGREILCYGVTPDILKAHPELRDADIAVWHKVMQYEGCLCIQAHPFRDRGYIENPGVLPLEHIDGIEVFNFCNEEDENEKAAEFARNHPSLITVAGGDAHGVNKACESGIMAKRRVRSEKEMADLLRSGEYVLIK